MQAYLINKKVVKPFIDDVITVGPGGEKSFKIINSFYPNECKRTKEYPCVLANCLFADSYIYSGAGPTYVTKIPLFTGASVAMKSTVHDDHVPAHKEGFSKINTLTNIIREGYSMRQGHRILLPEENSVWVPSYIVDPSTCVPKLHL